VELAAIENRAPDLLIDQVVDAIARLVHAAEIHERRRTDLEGGAR